MRILLQRVSRAAVRVEGEEIGSIGSGLLIFLGVADGDTQKDADWLVEKLAGLRVFYDEAGKMNLSVREVGGAALVVSQFTLYGDCRRGRRPSFDKAAAPAEANGLYEYFKRKLASLGLSVASGRFAAHMEVELVNDGPVTFIIDSPTP